MKGLLFGLALVLAAAPSSLTVASHQQIAEPPNLKSVAEAESEGRSYPRVTSPAHKDLNSITPSGTSDRTCADVGSNETVRSGDFVAGNFAAYPWIYRQGLGKLYWIPARWPELTASGWPRKGDMPLTVRATRLDADAPSQTYIFTTWAKPGDGKGDGDLFVPSGLRLPTPGKWMLVATAGPNWGCFVYDLPKQ